MSGGSLTSSWWWERVEAPWMNSPKRQSMPTRYWSFSAEIVSRRLLRSGARFEPQRPLRPSPTSTRPWPYPRHRDLVTKSANCPERHVLRFVAKMIARRLSPRTVKRASLRLALRLGGGGTVVTTIACRGSPQPPWWKVLHTPTAHHAAHFQGFISSDVILQEVQSISTAGSGPWGGAPRSTPVTSLTWPRNQIVNSSFEVASSMNAFSMSGASNHTNMKFPIGVSCRDHVS